MTRFIASFIIACCLPLLSCAQSNLALEASVTAGRVLKHNDKFTVPIPALSMACELALVKQTTGTQDWEQRRHYPVWGVAATYTHYGIDSIYGQVFGLYPFLQAYIIRGNQFEWTIRGGLGLGYATRHYERAPVWDTLNVAIGSSVNNFTRFSTDLRCRLSSRWSVQAGLSFSHLSNGAIKQPNLGVNMWGGQLGVRYWPGGDRPALVDRERPKLRNRYLAQLRLGFAANERGTTDGPIYPDYLASAYVSRRYRSRNKIFAGLDYSYHTGIYAFQRNNEINVGEEAAHSWKSAVFAGHEWLFGRGAVLVQVGYYLKDAALRQDPYYEKIGYNFYFIRSEHGALKELCGAVLLKTHKTIAELVEFGIGAGF